MAPIPQLEPVPIPVPTFRSRSSDFDAFAQIHEKISRLNSSQKGVLNFRQCDAIEPAGVVILGLLIRHFAQQRNIRVSLDVSSMQTQVERGLIDNGFAWAMGASDEPVIGDSIPFREDFVRHETGIIDYLTNEWLGRGWINVTEDAANSIAGQLYEVYANAFEHGDSQVGVFSCGHYFPEEERLILAVGDHGIGIPEKFKWRYRLDRAEPAHAIEWAFKRGTTTLPDALARGLGFDFLTSFVRENGGRLEVHSHKAHAAVTPESIRFSTLPDKYLPMTIIQVTLQCHQSAYPELTTPSVERYKW